MERAAGIITTNYTSVRPSKLAKVRPLAALPVGGRYRMIDFALSNMVNASIRTVGIILPYNYRSLVDHLGSGKEWALDRKHGGIFMLPGSPFGTASFGPRFLLRDLLDNRSFLEKEIRPFVVVTGANIICNMDYNNIIDAHIETGADITVLTSTARQDNPALTRFELGGDRVRASSVGVLEGDTQFLDCFVVSIDYLLGLLDLYQSVDYLDLFEALQGDYDRVRVQSYAYESASTMAIFSDECYYKNSLRMLETEVLDVLFDFQRPVFTKSHDNPPAKHEPTARVKHSIISGGSKIAGRVENSILGRDVVVSKGAVVKDSIIMQSCTIGPDAEVKAAIIDRNNTIPEKTQIKGTQKDVYIKGKGLDYASSF